MFLPDPSIGRWAQWRLPVGGAGFSIVGQCFLFCLLASIPLPILSLFGWAHLITNLLIYLITFFLLLLIIKPFNNEQWQILTNMYPVLSNKTKWFFRT